jgi:leader peptidase (prepilin peptidase)/N-methyltransferase
VRSAASVWLDRTPIIGWLFMSRLAPQKGAKFWVRPLLVELICAVAFAWLYSWEVGSAAMIPAIHPAPAAHTVALTPVVLHWQYLAHVLLFSFMLAASLIDLDEWIIPDAITVPGTLLALVLAVVAPVSPLAEGARVIADGRRILGVEIASLDLSAPFPWPEALTSDRGGGLVLALLCVWLWCFAEMPRTWRLRRGWAFAVKLFVARLIRERWTYWVLVIGAALTALVVPVWSVGGPRWIALLSALVGLAVGGGIIWLVRIVCSAVLRKEAMGFGDVTLMAMIGAFVGWQASILVFFLSPFFGLIPPLCAFLARSRVKPALPYGPFLCSAAAAVVLCWAAIWPWAAERFEIVFLLLGDWFLLLALAIGLALMAGLLALFQLAKRAF